MTIQPWMIAAAVVVLLGFWMLARPKRARQTEGAETTTATTSGPKTYWSVEFLKVWKEKRSDKGTKSFGLQHILVLGGVVALIWFNWDQIKTWEMTKDFLSFVSSRSGETAAGENLMDYSWLIGLLIIVLMIVSYAASKRFRDWTGTAVLLVLIYVIGSYVATGHMFAHQVVWGEFAGERSVREASDVRGWNPDQRARMDFRSMTDCPSEFCFLTSTGERVFRFPDWADEIAVPVEHGQTFHVAIPRCYELMYADDPVQQLTVRLVTENYTLDAATGEVRTSAAKFVGTNTTWLVLWKRPTETAIINALSLVHGQAGAEQIVRDNPGMIGELLSNSGCHGSHLIAGGTET